MDFQVLALRGTGGYRQYRIPALGVTPSGRIIAIYDGRPDLDDLPLPIDLVIRTSDDNGTTWSSQRIFQKAVDISGFGDSSILVDPTIGEQGRIFVFAQATHLAGFFESTLGSDPDDPMIVHIAVWRSDDDGQTWERNFITQQLKDPQTPGIFASSGMGSRITKGPFTGRLIHSFVLRREDKLLGALAYSDDHGDTWTLGALIPHGNESGVTALDDGSILLHSRATPFRLSGRSTDGGVTLSELGPDQELPDPSDNGSVCALSNGDVVCTHNHDSDLRRRTVIKRSRDGGRSWPEAALLESGSSAYSTVCELSDGRIGVLFERNGYAEIVFARVSSNDFAPTKTVLPLEVDENGVEFTIAFRYVRPFRKGDEVLGADTKRFIPKVDMSMFQRSSRKEIGQLGGMSSGERLYTSQELDVLLGPVLPGLHVGDEMRFSGRLTNYGKGSLREISITNSCDESTLSHDVLGVGEKIVFLDVRHIVTEADVQKGYVTATFTWSASANGHRYEGREVKKFSTTDGLPQR